MLLGLTKSDKALPALLEEAECAWPEAPTLGDLRHSIHGAIHGRLGDRPCFIFVGMNR